MTNFLTIFSILLYCLSTGLTEGYTWGKVDRWPRLFGYHFFRTVEILSIFVLTQISNPFWLVIGTAMFGFTIVYERALQYMQYGKLFVEQKPWHIIKWDIPIKNWHMVIIGILGLILTFLNF